MSWNVEKQLASWNLSMQTLVTLPLISHYGETYVTDGSQLCAFQSNDRPFGPCIVMEPVTGPLFDMTEVNKQFLYMLYKCGFMVAFFVSGTYDDTIEPRSVRTGVLSQIAILASFIRMWSPLYCAVE